MAENRNTNLLFGAAVAAAAIAVGVYFYKQRFGVEPVGIDPPVVAPVPNVAPNPIQHPLPQADSHDEPLPPLEQSDAAVHDALTSTFGNTVLGFLVPNNFIRNFVATVDNLPRSKLATRLNPVKPVAGEFVTTGTDDTVAMSPENAARYEPLVKIFQSTDSQQLVDTYLRFYPLLQSAYEELGYPNRYFNDRVVEVIDHLLATPTPSQPIELKQPKVFYEFVDPQLESLSAGQKALLRMGPAQAESVKAKLRDIRSRLAKAPGQ